MLGYSANLVIGILQTKDYAWAIFRAYFSQEEAEVIEGKVAARLSRREVFELEPRRSCESS
ncbi:Scr1 family TA system antitoxin-like transcriptional regulator [Streptomyces iranensis]|uniref:Scr1 family TA system antitoxin-like transcriptional regulator n=1 Tax=Streptomyces iranensis TaxID=576784 RepID=UPI0039B775B3